MMEWKSVRTAVSVLAWISAGIALLSLAWVNPAPVNGFARGALGVAGAMSVYRACAGFIGRGLFEWD